MSIDVKDIIKFTNKFLEVDKFKDYCVNGLQVEGALKTSNIITGVSFSQDLIYAAIKKKAKLIMVHHGIFKGHIGEVPQIKGFLKDRIKLLLENNINLVGYHLPLDAHRVVGNNISIIKELGLKKVDSIISPVYGEIGYIGEYKEGMRINDFLGLVEEKFEKKPYSILSGKKKIKRVGVVSGGASSDFVIASEMGCDTYVCGDIRENIVREVEETKINFINAGHYNSETFGIKNLGELIAKKFDVKVEFIDISNEI